jgi:hypothetical protein
VKRKTSCAIDDDIAMASWLQRAALRKRRMRGRRPRSVNWMQSRSQAQSPL